MDVGYLRKVLKHVWEINQTQTLLYFDLPSDSDIYISYLTRS